MHGGVAEGEAEEVCAAAEMVEGAEDGPGPDGPDVDVEEDAGRGDAAAGCGVALL
jgi:hypothetical protein